MITFFIAVACLVLGYLLYGKVIERNFGPDDRETPAVSVNDGVDFVPMPTWKVILIQILNIAGTGPIFGALFGALYGPIVYLWIVLGCIFAGAVHDYMCGMLSVRNGGASMPEITGKYLGNGMKQVMRVFSVILLIMCGVVFTTGPAGLLALLTPDRLDTSFWLWVVIVYFFIATFLPIDKVIGKFYPVFGLCLLFMALGVGGSILFSGSFEMPEIWANFENRHAQGTPVWPFMFITVACGAISGFHATQSPMVAKCITSEKQGRFVFYGAMIAEAVIALVWAAAGVVFYENTGALSEALAAAGQSGVVYDISFGMLGAVGGVLAVVGVIACPITSGDTAFRSARLILAEWTGLSQKPFKNRLKITLPLLFVGLLLTQLDFDVLWRYFSWSNQTLAMVALWVATAYLQKETHPFSHLLLTALPATFMTGVSATYILMAPEGLRLPASVAVPVGAAAALLCFVWFLYVCERHRKGRKLK